MPFSNKFRTFLAFFESLSFLDSAENGRPSFFPEALRLASDDFVRWEIKFLSISAARLRNFFSGNTQVSKIYYKLWMAKRANRLPLVIMTSFRILITSFFIVTVVHKFLTENTNVTFFLLLLTIFSVYRSRWLLDQYLKIEAQFLSNLKGKKAEEEQSGTTDNK